MTTAKQQQNKLRLLMICCSWTIYTMVTGWAASSIFEVYPKANRLLWVFPFIGFQFLYWLAVFGIGVIKALRTNTSKG